MLQIFLITPFKPSLQISEHLPPFALIFVYSTARSPVPLAGTAVQGGIAEAADDLHDIGLLVNIICTSHSPPANAMAREVQSPFPVEFVRENVQV